VQLKNNLSSSDALYNYVSTFYFDLGRKCVIFEHELPSDDVESGYFIRFLLDRRHVIEYKIAVDRGLLLSIVSLAIGPQYFTPGDFWDYKNAQRFSLEASTDAVDCNLKLLDEFFRI
jgi:hypothetical protein